MIIINGVNVPSPTSYAPSLMDITHAERNSKATMFIDMIAQKWKLELTWGVLTKAELATLMNALEADITFSVTFTDLYGEEQTRTFYKGDRGASMILFKGSEPIWKDFKVSLIEV